MTTTPRKPNQLYTHNGVSLSFQGWADKLGISRITFYRRFADAARLGWTEAEAMDMAVNNRGWKNHKYAR